jgi:hypothetical protein
MRPFKIINWPVCVDLTRFLINPVLFIHDNILIFPNINPRTRQFYSVLCFKIVANKYCILMYLSTLEYTAVTMILSYSALEMNIDGEREHYHVVG